MGKIKSKPVANKTEYILRSLQKIKNKKWEFYIISRIIHGLSDDEIEFVTQQLVRRTDGTKALTDIYFPQFNLHLEIDEPEHLNQIDEDDKREQDIVQETGHNVERIKIAYDNKVEKDLDTIRTDVDAWVDKILEWKKEAGNNFTPWDYEKKYSSEAVIALGHVSVDDNVVFRTQVEAMRCFGFTGKGWQRGAWKINDGTDDILWFPRLYQHGIWHNELINDGTRICEKAAVGEDSTVNEEAIASIKKQIEDGKKRPSRTNIVFAKARDSLGFNLLRYVGTFKMNFSESTEDNLIFDRVGERENVRPPS